MQECKNRDYCVVYTVLFLTVFLIGWQSFWQQDKAFIWSADGQSQHFPALVYLGRWLRTIVNNIFSGNFTVPLVDLKIGMGDDIIGTLNYYALGDILNLLAVFVPPSHTETLFGFLAIFRCYLAGITFSYFCFQQKKKYYGVLIGSLSYAFCGFAFLSSMRHPYFINPMIYMPLMLCGLEKILKKENPLLLIITTCFAAMSGFYFLYMVSVFMVVYAIVRVCFYYKDTFWKSLLTYGLRAGGSYIIGICMSAVIFLPAVLAFLNSSRNGLGSANVDSLIFMSVRQYLSFPIRFISGSGWDSLAMASITLLCVVILIMQYKKNVENRFLTVLFFICMIFWVVPFFGWMFNGFGYVTQRWTFIFAFVVSLITASVLSDLKHIHLEFVEKAACFIVVAMYILMYIAMHTVIRTSLGSFRNIQIAAAVTMLGITFVALVFLSKYGTTSKSQRKHGKTTYIASHAFLMLIVCINLILNAHLKFDKNVGNYVSEMVNRGTALSCITELPQPPGKYINDDFARIDTTEAAPYNAAMTNDFNGVAGFWSILNTCYATGLKELEDFNMATGFRIKNLDNRTILDTLFSVKYFLTVTGKEALVPYGFTAIDEMGNRPDYLVYENQNTLPLGYTYTKSISKTAYEELNPIDKQEALLQAVVLEKGNTDINNLKFRSKKLNYTIEKVKGMTFENGMLKAEKDNASMKITFKGLPDSETYIRLYDFSSSAISSSNLKIKGELSSKNAEVRFQKDDLFWGQHNYTANLGYHEEPQNTAIITIEKKGTYTIGGIEVYCYPFDSFEAQAGELKQDVLENIEIDTNKIRGNISLDSDKTLVLTIPYSKGWSAKVNGENQELLQTNMFMALPLTAGKHDIELNYFTYGLKSGICLSVLGLVLCIGIGIFYKKREMKNV